MESFLWKVWFCYRLQNPWESHFYYTSLHLHISWSVLFCRSLSSMLVTGGVSFDFQAVYCKFTLTDVSLKDKCFLLLLVSRLSVCVCGSVWCGLWQRVNNYNALQAFRKWMQPSPPRYSEAAAAEMLLQSRK